jgi:protein-tyrosine phosphatase
MTSVPAIGLDPKGRSAGMLGRSRHVIGTNYGTVRGLVRHWLAEAEYVSGRLDCWLAPEPRRVRRLVFVCLGNINRSAFASAVAQLQGAASISIGLATTTGAPAFPMAIARAPLHGVDLSTHTATDISDYRFAEGDLLLAMEIRHARQLVERGIPSAAIALLGHWASPHRIHIHDPHTLSAEYFATCFSIIESAVRNMLDEFRPAKTEGA